MASRPVMPASWPATSSAACVAWRARVVRKRGRVPAAPALSTLVLCALALAACRKPRVAEFRIGLIRSIDRGTQRAADEPGRHGAAVAVGELNAAGGVRIAGVPHRIVLVERTTAARPDAAASVARELVNLESVDVLVGPNTSALAEAAGAVAEAAGVPLIAPLASAAPVTEGREFVTRLAFLDGVQGRLLARFARDSMRLGRVASMHNAASIYGRDIVTLFATEFRSRGGLIVAAETFDADDPASRIRAIRRLAAARPEAVLLPNFSSADSLDLRQMRTLGFRGRLLGSDFWDAAAIERSGIADGAIVTANWDRRAERPELQAFLRAFSARYPEERPRATAAANYDAIRLLAAAAARAGTRSGAPVARALRTMGEYAGAFGSYRFIGNGDPVRGAVILELRGDSSRLRALYGPLP